jgi:phosphomannomutase / phosphoglucomutase
MSIYKACDIRGKFGTELCVEHAERLGQAITALKGAGRILVGGDGRISTPDLKEALVESLLARGWEVIDLGLAPTPLFYFARRQLGIELGVMVTASHNPALDNGFKLTLGPMPVTVEEMAEIERQMEAAGATTDAPAGQGKYTRVDLLDAYLEFLAAHIPDLSGMRVVIDCASGMGGLVARAVWEKTGADVRYLLEAVDGNFPAHAPNPAEAKNLALLAEQVTAAGADLGVAYDGDADRVAFVDERGQAVTGDQAVVLFAQEMLRGGPETVIYDQKCSRIVADAIRAAGGEPVRELSGHTYIKRAFLERRAVYAGELSGHHFLREVEGDDAPAASLVFARLVKDSGAALSRLLTGIPSYPITPDLRLPMPAAEIRVLIDRLEASLSGEAVIERGDGLRIEYADGWALVRPSVTEPVVTLRFEGVTPAALERIMRRVGEAAPVLSGIGAQGTGVPSV